MLTLNNLIKSKKIVFLLNFLIINFFFGSLAQYKVISSESKSGNRVTNTGLLEEFNRRKDPVVESYILGAQDTLRIDFDGFDLLDRIETVKIDGTLELPRIGTIYVAGLTIKELKLFLKNEYTSFVINPKISIKILRYRPVRVFVGGEVVRPGFYTLSGTDLLQSLSEEAEKEVYSLGVDNPQDNFEGFDVNLDNVSNSNVFPTVFDAIRRASGITTNADLSKINIVRDQTISEGGGKKMTTLTFLPLLTDGELSQNIRLYDGDRIDIAKSDVFLKDQILKAGQSNLSPKYISVFVTGRVKNPGTIRIPSGTVLSQALVLANPKVIRGKIEFVRFTNEGKLDRRLLSYTKSSRPSKDNPILMSGDIINFRNSLITTTLETTTELTAPIMGIYSFTRLFGID